MSYLQAVPKAKGAGAPPKGYRIVTPDSSEVVYLDDSPTLDVITAALTAWGLRVREGSARTGDAMAALPIPADSSWQTTRPTAKAPGRLANGRSPVYLPALLNAEASRFDAQAEWAAWFGAAA